MVKKFFAEFLATAMLVLVGCGAAMAFTFAGMAGTPAATVGIAAAFGISIVILAYTVGRVSGGHANPAVSFAKALNKEISWKECGIYCCAQVVGAFFGSLLLAMVMWAWKTGVSGANGVAEVFYKNTDNMKAFVEGKAAFMPFMLATMAEMGLTFLFVILVLGVTNKKEWSNIAGLVIGLALFGVHIVGIPLTGTSVNPARALSALVFSMFDGKGVGLKALTLIPTIVGPLMGAFAAASTYKAFFGKEKAE